MSTHAAPARPGSLQWFQRQGRRFAWLRRIPCRNLYVLGAFTAGLANLVLMLAFNGAATADRVAFLLLALLILTLLPLRPIPGAVTYIILWVALLSAPTTGTGDMAITNAVFFFLLGLLLPLRASLPLASSLPLAVLIPAGPINIAAATLFLMACTLPAALLLRRTVEAWHSEVSTATQALLSIRGQIAREMHDIVAYSMSQTVLLAQRAAADSSYPAAARQEFALIESTASNALHELRLVLRALRRNESSEESSLTGLGTVILDLDAAVRAVSDDVSAAGFQVTYQTHGKDRCSRLQATTLSLVARELGSNIIRHGDPEHPVTITLIQDTAQVRLMVTNAVAASPTRGLPSSGTGVLGMKERLSTIAGTLETLNSEGSWIASVTVPLPPPSPSTMEDPA